MARKKKQIVEEIFEVETIDIELEKEIESLNEEDFTEEEIEDIFDNELSNLEDMTKLHSDKYLCPRCRNKNTKFITQTDFYVVRKCKNALCSKVFSIEI